MSVDSLYRQSLTGHRGGRRVLRGRLVLDDLLTGSGPAVMDADVVRLSDRDNIVQVLVGLSTDVRREVLGLVPDGQYYPSLETAQSRQLDHELLKRGVHTRYVQEPGWLADAGGASYAAGLTSAGAELRVTDRVPHRLMIFDRSVAVLPIDPADVGRGALVVREASIVRSLHGLFNGVWQRSTELDRFESDAELGCDERTREVLELMSSGFTDESAAHSLEVSVRTYRRYVADLMRRLDAKSRFQAGVRAVERGWL